MEISRKKRSSDGGGGGSFSFPSTPMHDTSSSFSSGSSDDFEFGSCLTPDSPAGEGVDLNRSSPADHLFFNGRLLPHSFPFHPPPRPAAAGPSPAKYSSGAPSRTSSVGSKDSLLSSRSNSTGSRSSSCSSSARTSTSAASSDGSERRPQAYGRPAGKAAAAQVYGSSQRWQFMAPVPALSRETSRLRMAAPATAPARRDSPRRKKKAVVKRSRSRRFGRRIFRWLVSACKKCHAIEPSRKDKILRKNVNLR